MSLDRNALATLVVIAALICATVLFATDKWEAGVMVLTVAGGAHLTKTKKPPQSGAGLAVGKPAAAGGAL